MQVKNDWLDVAELPLSDFKADLDWPERCLRPESRPKVYFTRFAEMGCHAALLVAPKRHVIGIAPTSSYWKHAQVMAPTPIQGGSRQLHWLSKVHSSPDMAARFRRDLERAGHKRSVFRRGLFPYEGGACIGLPPVAVSANAGPNLSQYAFRTYLFPSTASVVDDFVREMEFLLGSLQAWVIRASESGFVEDRDCEDWALIRQGSSPHPSQDAECFALVGNEERQITVTERTARIRQLSAATAQRAEEVAAARMPLAPGPLLADFAIRLPAALTMSAALKRNMTSAEVAALDQQNVAISDLFVHRTRLLCRLRWPTLYWAAYEGIRAGEKMPASLASVTESVDALKALLSELQEQSPVLSDRFLEVMWDAPRD